MQPHSFREQNSPPDGESGGPRLSVLETGGIRFRLFPGYARMLSSAANRLAASSSRVFAREESASASTV